MRANEFTYYRWFNLISPEARFLTNILDRYTIQTIIDPWNQWTEDQIPAARVLPFNLDAHGHYLRPVLMEALHWIESHPRLRKPEKGPVLRLVAAYRTGMPTSTDHEGGGYRTWDEIAAAIGTSSKYAQTLGGWAFRILRHRSDGNPVAPMLNVYHQAHALLLADGVPDYPPPGLFRCARCYRPWAGDLLFRPGPRDEGGVPNPGHWDTMECPDPQCRGALRTVMPPWNEHDSTVYPFQRTRDGYAVVPNTPDELRQLREGEDAQKVKVVVR